MRHSSLRRVIGCLVAASLFIGVAACGDSSDPNEHNSVTNATTVESVEPVAFVYQDQAFCVYPDDMDELDGTDGVVDDAIVGTYCSEVYDSRGQTIPQDRWIEADEVDNFIETDTSRSTLVWIYYLTYMDDWFLSQMFIDVYLTTVRDAYLAKQYGHQAKYAIYIVKYKPLGRYHTKTGVVVGRGDTSGKYRIVPPSCKPVAFDGSGLQFAPAALAEKPVKPNPKVTPPKVIPPKVTPPKATPPKAVVPTKATNKTAVGNTGNAGKTTAGNDKPTYTAPRSAPTRRIC